MPGQIGRRKSGAWPASVRAYAPKLSTCVVLVFALAAILPWFAYAWITQVDRAEQFANAEERLELLATVYAQQTVDSRHAIIGGPGAPHANGAIEKVSPDQNELTWIRSLPGFPRLKFSTHPIDENPETPAQAPAPIKYQPVKIRHSDGVLNAEVDIPAARIATVASITDEDVLKQWGIRTRLAMITLVVRTLLTAGIGAFLFYQLRWREAAQAELIRTRDAAEKAARAKSEFLASMSHELRTPLNAIIGFSEAIKLGMLGPLSNRYREYGEHIFKSGAHLLQLVDDVLDASKLEAARFELHETEVDLPTLIQSAMRLVQGSAEKSGIILCEDISPGLPAIFGDVRRLRQILLNLASNAVKFTRPGGEVRVSAAETAAGIIIKISDSGIGMTADEIPLALEPFRQVTSRFRSKFDGTGLGLPIAKKLVELHGGTLSIISEVEVGTTVTICLPAARFVSAATSALSDHSEAIAVA